MLRHAASPGYEAWFEMQARVSAAMSEIAVCTVATKSHLARARVLAESYRSQHPGAPLFLLLLDRIDGRFDPAREPFTTVCVEDVGAEDWPSLAFRYSQVELPSAMKPRFLLHLFENFGFRKIVYLDTDVFVTGDLEPVFDLLDRHSVVLTPHLLAPASDGPATRELVILRSGAYNTGMVGVSDLPEARAFLHWWWARCRENALVRQHEGVFLDQRWIDLAPGMFPGVGIARDPGLNVAFWNVRERRVTWEEKPSVNGVPLRFFHFSAFPYDGGELLSLHPDADPLDDHPELVPLFAEYRRRLAQRGHDTCLDWPYAFGYFENGVPITQFARDCYREMPPGERLRFGDPREAGSPDSFWCWLNAPADAGGEDGSGTTRVSGALRRRMAARRRRPSDPPYVSRLMYLFWQREPELRRRFPEPLGRDRDGLLRWFGRRDPMREAACAATYANRQSGTRGLVGASR